jgi:uncharacterized protein (TIGR02246 family)
MIPKSPARRRAAALLLAAALAPAASATAAPDARVPLVVTVDDLPMSGGDLHATAADRAAATAGMLAALREHSVPAVGLVTWGNVRVDGDRELLGRWLDAGFELGNHSLRHLDYHRVEADEWLADVEAARAAIDGFLLGRGGRPQRFFRFPFLREGDSDAKLDAARAWLAAKGLRNLPVSIDDQDWSFERPFVEARRRGDEAEAARIAEAYHESLHLSVRHHRARGRALFEREPAQILLLHATAIGASEWDRLFTWLEGEGFRFATADEALADPAYAEDPRFLGPRGPGLWDRILDGRRRAAAEGDVRRLLAEQVAAWNRGDVEAFTSAYADEAIFVSPDEVTRGRREVTERYRRRYPDGAAMGQLAIDVETVRLTAGGEVSMLGDAVPGDVHGARVVARWTLEKADGSAPRSGPTFLSLERRGGRWWIAEDVSMEGPAKAPAPLP